MYLNKTMCLYLAIKYEDQTFLALQNDVSCSGCVDSADFISGVCATGEGGIRERKWACKYTSFKYDHSTLLLYFNIDHEEHQMTQESIVINYLLNLV